MKPHMVSHILAVKILPISFAIRALYRPPPPIAMDLASDAVKHCKITRDALGSSYEFIKLVKMSRDRMR